jgi:hypothetical protein
VINAVKSLLPVTVLILSFILSSCGQSSGTEESFETIDQGVESQIETETIEIIRDETAWSEFWTAHAGPNSEAPTVDFDTEMVIAIQLGTRPSSGYEVEVTGVTDANDALRVYYRETVPGTDCFTLPVLTHPFHIVKLARNEKEGKFTRRLKAGDCPCTSDADCEEGFSCWYVVPRGPGGIRGSEENPGACYDNNFINQLN